jgi:hypothetical protein
MAPRRVPHPPRAGGATVRTADVSSVQHVSSVQRVSSIQRVSSVQRGVRGPLPGSGSPHTTTSLSRSRRSQAVRSGKKPHVCRGRRRASASFDENRPVQDARSSEISRPSFCGVLELLPREVSAESGRCKQDMGYRSAQICLGGSQPNEQVSGGICSWFVKGVFEGGQASPPAGVTTGVTSRGYRWWLQWQASRTTG